jgi:hypothetical protein
MSARDEFYSGCWLLRIQALASVRLRIAEAVEADWFRRPGGKT